MAANQRLHDDIEKNAELLGELGSLVLKQQLLISKAFQGGAEERRKKGNAKRIQNRLREKPPIATGCRVKMWKQDPSVKSVPLRTVFLPNDVEEGPVDKHIKILLKEDKKVQKAVAPDKNGDMLLDWEKEPLSFDLVQVYSVIRMCVNMMQRDLQMDWRWQWDTANPGPKRTPLNVICHAGVKQNAVYLRSRKMLKFYYFHDDDQKKDIYLCRSLDIVAHETGHAVLDALKPALYSIKTGQEGAMHEAFSDLMAIFLTLSQFDMCEEICAHTKGDLRANRFLSAIGEQFAAALADDNGGDPDEDPSQKGDPDEPGESHNSVGRGCRDANNEFKGTEVKGPYELAQVFTGYIFDILCAVFTHERNPFARDDAETLYRTARILRRIFLLGVFASPKAPNFMDISKAMEHAVNVVAADDDVDEEFWKEKIIEYRLTRELEDAGKPKKDDMLLGGDEDGDF